MGNKNLFNEKILNYIKNYMELLTFVIEANYILNQIIFCKHSTKRTNVKNTLEFGKTVFSYLRCCQCTQRQFYITGTWEDWEGFR